MNMFCELATRHMISYYNMASFQGGGYDCQFVDPPQELQTECAICLHVVREPYLVDCCGYRFCRVCIENVDTEARKAQPVSAVTPSWELTVLSVRRSLRQYQTNSLREHSNKNTSIVKIRILVVSGWTN